uniref:Uncharacterized protein n=1 Tax=Panagrolaimus sp. PS1159 TaxID=55785 RepID=A0AC35G5L0_9BILA
MGQSSSNIFALQKGNTNSVTVPIIKSPFCIKVKINGKKFTARVSTGTSRSVCSNSVLECLNVEMNKKEMTTINAPMGQTLDAIGQAELTLLIKNAEIHESFYVTEKLAEDLIIGMDIILKFGGFGFNNNCFGKTLTLG